MSTPLPPFVDYVSLPFDDINDEGLIILECTFTGKLLGLYVTNKVNNEIIVQVNIINGDVSYELYKDTLAPNESVSIMKGQFKIIKPDTNIYIQTNYKTHFISCIMDYAKFNELDP